MSAQLKMRFGTMSGEKTWTFKNADENATTTNVRALAQTMITNGSVYKYPPLSVVSAQMVITTTVDYEME